MKKNDYLERILSSRVYDVALETPLELASNLSARLGNRLHLKREDLQPVFSFKLRGAYNKMAQLPAAALKRGVIAASAGNHALGLAYHAQLLGIPATVVMPCFAPLTKIVNCRRLGANVVLDGANIGEARARADNCYPTLIRISTIVQPRSCAKTGFKSSSTISGISSTRRDTRRSTPRIASMSTAGWPR